MGYEKGGIILLKKRKRRTAERWSTGDGVNLDVSFLVYLCLLAAATDSSGWSWSSRWMELELELKRILG